jgi:hypothetical protein
MELMPSYSSQSSCAHLQEMSSLKIDLFVFHKSYIMFLYVPLLSPFSPPMLSIISLWSNFEGCLLVCFVCFVCRIKIYQTHVDAFCHTLLHNIEKLWMGSRCALSSFHNLSTYSGEVIECY